MSTKTKSQRSNWATRVVTFLSSQTFFYVVLGLFLVHTLWFVASARYPMAFDENVHIGLIQLHAEKVLPFFTEQPPNADQYGVVVRDPSYMYHYLMSIPYQILGLFTSNEMAKVIVLRLINVGLFVWIFVLFRKLLDRTGSSRALSHVALFLFALVPIVPFLAAHVNYDTLLILVFLLSALATLRIVESLRNKVVDIRQVSVLALLLLFGSLVKYAFLPIAFALVLYLGICAVYYKVPLKAYSSGLKTLKTLSKPVLVGGVLLFVILGGLFAERYAVNVVRYGAPNPECSKVLSVSSCLQWGPWGRDYRYEQSRNADFQPDPVAYAGQWLKGMWRRSFFAINHNYANKWPLPITGKAAIVVAILALPLLAWRGYRLVKGNHAMQLVLLAMIIYIGALTAQIYATYTRTGVPVAINGRYLIPFLPVVFVLVGLAYGQLFGRRVALKVIAACIVMALFLQNGGVTTFIVQSERHWYWQNQTIISINETAQKILRPIVIEGTTNDPQ